MAYRSPALRRMAHAQYQANHKRCKQGCSSSSWSWTWSSGYKSQCLEVRGSSNAPCTCPSRDKWRPSASLLASCALMKLLA
eukprot:1160467-Pelagomonas_calceolata.AAC.6